jgi:hypothetical protein
MKTAISIPDPVFQAANALAARLGVSRSELIARAVSSYVMQHDDTAVTRRLDEIYGVSSVQPDPDLVRAKDCLLRDEGWSNMALAVAPGNVSLTPRQSSLPRGLIRVSR